MKRTDWYLFECFRVAGRLQHISRAAEQLGTSQPTLSRSLSILEKRLKKKLFIKAGRSVRLTDEGQRLHRTVEQAFANLGDLDGMLSGPSPDQVIRINIGFLRTLGSHFVPKLVSAFSKGKANVQFGFDQSSNRELVDKLAKHELDLIYTITPEDGSRLEWAQVLDQRFIVITPHGHRLIKKKKLALRDLEPEPFITFQRGHPIRTFIDHHCSLDGFSPRVIFEANDSSCIPGFVAAGFGVAVMPIDCEFGANVVSLELSPPTVRRPIVVAWLKDRYLSPPVRELLQFSLTHRSS